VAAATAGRASLGLAELAAVAGEEVDGAQVAADVVGEAEQGAVEHGLGELGGAVGADALELAGEVGERLLELVERVEVDAVEDLLVDDAVEQGGRVVGAERAERAERRGGGPA
jgi:hypothetical protein